MSSPWPQDLVELNRRHKDSSPAEILRLGRSWFPGSELAFANSFGLEDIVVQHLLFGLPDPPESFVLDTGRLPEETYELIERWRLRYGLNVRLYSPQAEALEDFTARHGPNAFYESRALRQACCAIRKLEPLERGLRGKKAWISGLRREQSQARSELEVFSQDAGGRIKISPLAHWTLEQVWAYVREQQLPYNRLHDRGYPSIGCAPCTRAIEAGEDLRAGRWWWEIDSERECGLHSPRPAHVQEGSIHV